MKADIIIAGGGLGGVSSALAALRNQLKVIMTEETDWIGGQLTSQGVPPDEHKWIETHGAPLSYRTFREAVRTHYKQHYPLTDNAKQRSNLNPGDGAVSRLCHEPRIAWNVMIDMLSPYLSNGQLILLTEHKIKKAHTEQKKVIRLSATCLKTKKEMSLEGDYFIDATESGELLPLTNTAYVTGTESKTETGELHAPEKTDPTNNQSFTVCFAVDYVPGEDHTIEKPESYEFWRTHIPNLSPAWPGKLLSLTYTYPSTLEPKTLGFHPEGNPTGDVLNLWNYRKIINRYNFTPGVYKGDITIINWPQNDYMLGNIIDVPEKEFNKHVEKAKQLSLSLLYWLQTEVDRPDGGKGWPGIRLRKDVMGTEDGLAKYPYIRESRRIKALFTIKEEHVGQVQSASNTAPKCNGGAVAFHDSVGIGYYPIDLHPTCNGYNYIDFPSVPFQIPLGALIPIETTNLLPANKNIGTTHITNGCYRLHPVEWSIGEAVGCLVTFAKKTNKLPKEIRNNETDLKSFQQFIQTQGIEIDWPKT